MRVRWGALLTRASVPALCVSLVVVAVPATAGKQVPSRVVIDKVYSCPIEPCSKESGTFGTVTSRKTACERRRTVIVRVIGEKEYGRDTTNAAGDWHVEQTPPGTQAEVEAVVKRRRLASGKVCKADVSPPYHWVVNP